jgi:hypothetical protein
MQAPIKCYNFYISEKQFLKENYQALFKEQVQIMNDEFRKSETFETLNSLLPLINTNLENDLNNLILSIIMCKHSKRGI